MYDGHLAVLDVLECRDIPVTREVIHEYINELRRTVIRAL